MAEYKEKGDNADFLHQLRQDYSDDESGWKPIRDEAQADMRIVGGNGWSKAEEALRAELKRLALNFDEISQYNNQLINDIHQNKRAIKVTPNGNGANDKEAELRANRIRQTEYRSNAQQVHTITFKNTVECSYGWGRINTRWLNEKKQEQEIVFEGIPNPHMVTPGPHIMPDGSDIKRLWFKEWWTHDEFRQRLPGILPKPKPGEAETDLSSFLKDFSSREWQDTAPAWLNSKSVLICEYWVKKVDGSVCMYLTNGVDVLRKDEWAGKDIPFIPCYGPVLFVTEGGKTERRIHSYHRLARDPVQSYNFTLTAIAEMISQIPKFPYFAYRDSLTPGELENLQRSVSEPVAVIQVETKIPDVNLDGPPPFPQRNPYDPSALAGLMQTAEMYRRSIQSAMALGFLPTQAQRHNEKSGVALKQIEDSGQRGSYHFIASFEGYLTRFGKLTNDLLAPTHDTARDMTARKPDDSTYVVRINDPAWVNPETQQQEHLTFTDADFDVTISTGPQNDSEREAQSDFADLLLQSPEIAQIIGPQNMQKVLAKVIKLKNVGPLGDAIADIIDPPQQDGQVDPQQQQQKMAAMGEAIDKLNMELKQRVQQIETDQIKADAATKLQKLKFAHDKEVQQMKNSSAMEVAVLNARAKGITVGMEFDEEALALGAQQQHEADQAEMDRQHEAAMAQQQHAQNTQAGAQDGEQQAQQSAQDHSEAMQAGEAGHAQSLEQGAQQAALAPQPEAGA